jgi:hypothetical protein
MAKTRTEKDDGVIVVTPEVTEEEIIDAAASITEVTPEVTPEVTEEVVTPEVTEDEPYISASTRAEMEVGRAALAKAAASAAAE